MGDEASDGFVSGSHGNAFADEVFHECGGVEEAILETGSDAIFAEFSAGDDGGGEFEAGFEGIEGREEREFVFLKIAVVGHGETFEEDEQLWECCINASRPSANEFEDVGVAFLGHDGGAGGVGIGESKEAEFSGEPNDPFFRPGAEMCGNEGHAECEFNEVIAVAGDVEAIGGDRVESEEFRGEVAINWQRGSGERGGTERADIDSCAAVGEPFTVALEFLDIGEPVMSGHHGLCALQMRVAGHEYVGVGRAAIKECELDIGEQPIEFIDGFTGVEFEVCGNLIVAAAAGVEPATDIPDASNQGVFNVHMDIFQILAEGELPGGDFFSDLVEVSTDVVAIFGADDSALSEHCGVGHRTADVDGIEPLIKADGFGERLDSGIGCLMEPSAPCFCHCDCS
ncbi:MAG: hypothetical protein RL215_2493 [Planctomycetota bacterium]